MTVSTTLFLQKCLQRLHVGESTVREELLRYARGRLKLLAERMFVRFLMLGNLEEADDLLQESMLRLWKSLAEVRPTTVSGFMGLAALQMRRSLRDLARKHFGRRSELKSHQRNLRLGSTIGQGVTVIDDVRNSPDVMLSWSEFHEAADRLPQPERTCFDLMYYHGLPQNEVAELMNVSIRQVARYWQSARRMVLKAMEGCSPDE